MYVLVGVPMGWTPSWVNGHPTGYAIWPLSGICLAAVLKWGMKYSSVVFLGQFIVTLFQMSRGHSLNVAHIVLMTLGAGLSNVASVILVTKVFGFSGSFQKLSDFTSIIIGVSVSELLSTLLGSVSLEMVLKYSNINEIVYSSATYWASGVLGALIFTPILLPNKSRIKPRGGGAATFSSILIFSLILVAETDNIAYIFGRSSQFIVNALFLTMLLMLILWSVIFLQVQEFFWIQGGLAVFAVYLYHHGFIPMPFEVREPHEKLAFFQVSLIALTVLMTSLNMTLNRVQAESMEVAYRAGMAEIVSGTIHNLGNILNSTTVALESLSRGLENSEIFTFIQGSKTLKEHSSKLVEFINHDPKGILLLELFMESGSTLENEYSTFKGEVRAIQQGMDNIKGVLIEQKKYSGRNLHQETVQLSEFLDDILQLEAEELRRGQIKIQKNYVSAPTVSVQKNNLMNVLINVIKNARESMSETPIQDRLLKIEVVQEGTFVKILVSDSGVGIAPENLKNIFKYSFTTKEGGHGFGLHSSATALSEMGGKISVESRGLGKGTTFTVQIPKDGNLWISKL